jgi:hypothetical protein
MSQDLYDQAVFVQELRKKAHFNRVTRQNVIDAFWIAAWDLKVAIEQQAPQKWDAVNKALERDMLPGIIASLETDTNLRVDP